MTPEQAEKIYYEAYGKARKEAGLRCEPIEQRKISLKAWEAVLEAVNEEHTREYVQSYLRLNGPLLNEGS